MMQLSGLTLLLVFLGHFLEPGSTQDLIVQPEGTVTLTLNQMINATFNCECTLGEACNEPFWSLQNEGKTITTEDSRDEDALAQRGITYSSTRTTAVISIPDTVENNNTLISCAAFIGGIAFSPAVELIIIGPPLPPEPALVINSSSQLNIHWEIPYSNELYPVDTYGILIVNMSSGNVLDNVLNINDTTYVYIFEDEVQYCQILIVNVTALSALGSSASGSASIGFPIAPHQFDMDIDIDVTFLRNGTPMVNITFEAPLICDYQTAIYVLTFEDLTDPTVDLEPIQSSYAGSDRNVTEVVQLTVDHNYTLFIFVVENYFGVEVSMSKNFSTFQSLTTSHALTATFPEQTEAASGSLSLRAGLMCLIAILLRF